MGWSDEIKGRRRGRNKAREGEGGKNGKGETRVEGGGREWRVRPRQ